MFLAFSLPYTTTRKFIFYHFWNYVPTPGSTKSMHNVSVLNSTDPLAGESLISTLSGITEAVLACRQYVVALPSAAEYYVGRKGR